VSEDPRIEFEVSTPDGRVTVRIPEDLSPADARWVARRVAGIIEAMFAPSAPYVSTATLDTWDHHGRPERCAHMDAERNSEP